MNNNIQLKIALLSSLIGVILLFVVSQLIDIESIEINDIDESYIGKTVKIEGSVTNAIVSDKISTLYIDESDVKIIVFSRIEINKSQKINIIGKVDEELQIIADKIINI